MSDVTYCGLQSGDAIPAFGSGLLISHPCCRLLTMANKTSAPFAHSRREVRPKPLIRVCKDSMTSGRQMLHSFAHSPNIRPWANPIELPGKEDSSSPSPGPISGDPFDIRTRKTEGTPVHNRFNHGQLTHP